MQRFQRIDGGHHRAAFKACGRGETRRPKAHQPSVRPGSQKRSRQNHFSWHPTPPPQCHPYTTPQHAALKSCSCFWTGPNPLWTPASLYGSFPRRQVAKKPCWTPRQHDTISNGNKSTHLKRLAAFAKASRSQEHNVCLSGQSQHTEAAALTAAHSGQSCPDCSSGPTRVIEGSSSTVSSQPSRISPEPFTITKRQTTASSKTLEDFFFFYCAHLHRVWVHQMYSKQAGITCWLRSGRRATGIQI